MKHELTKSNLSKRIATTGILTSLIFIVLMLDTYVFVFMKPAPPAILTLPLVLALCLYSKFPDSVIGGAIFGVLSLIVAFMIGNEVFINPLISVLPRVFIGIVAFSVLKLMKYLTRKSNNNFVKNYLTVGVASAFGVITNTVLVLGAISIFKNTLFTASLMEVVLSINFVFELLSAIILTPILVVNIKKIVK